MKNYVDSISRVYRVINQKGFLLAINLIIDSIVIKKISRRHPDITKSKNVVEGNSYMASYWPSDIKKALSSLNLNFANMTAIDLGAGKGLSSIFLSKYNFKRLIAIELDPELFYELSNISREYKFVARHISALDFARETDVEVDLIYAFNPFSIETLSIFIDILLERFNRPLYLIYFKPQELDFFYSKYLVLKNEYYRGHSANYFVLCVAQK